MPDTQAPPVSRRLTSPTFSRLGADRITEAAEKQGRTVGNFIARAATLAADKVLEEDAPSPRP